jgi:AraC-like DNA-binding protein
MQWTDLHWKMPLETPPHLQLMVIGVHGPSRQIERFMTESVWAVHLYRYTAELTIDGVIMPIKSGYAGITPPGKEAAYRFPEKSVHACAHFACAGDAPEGVAIPAMQDLGDDFAAVNAAFEEGIACFPANPRRATARLWDILWRLAERGRPRELATHTFHPAVEQAREIIALRLSEPIDIARLADEVGLSHNHLTRLFRQMTGQTVIGYIQQRRIERARHLLLRTTLPVKTIAAQVGIADQRLFSKTIRKALGDTPMGVRRAGQTTLPAAQPAPQGQ